jgi:hypothetical protein
MSGVKGRSGGHNKVSIAEHKRRRNYRPSRHGREGDVPAAVPLGTVVKPTWLSAAAGVVWDRLAPQAAAMGTLMKADVCAFSTLCELQATFETVCATKSSGWDASTWKVQRETAAAIRPWLSMFGFTLEGRNRLNVKPANPNDPFAEFDNPLARFLKPRARWPELK